MKTIKVKFIRNGVGLGLSYFADDTPELEEKLAKEVIKEGYAEAHSEENESDLPLDLPYRKVFVELGMTLDEIKECADLTALNGIGEKSAKAVEEYLNPDNE